jgi:hypothetical protein
MTKDNPTTNDSSSTKDNSSTIDEDPICGEGIMMEPDNDDDLQIPGVNISPVADVKKIRYWLEREFQIPLSDMLDFPLRFGFVDAPDYGNPIHNDGIEKLGIIVDPDSKMFGQCGFSFHRPGGKVIITRVDGQNLYIAQVHALVTFADVGLNELRTVPRREKTGETIDRKEMVTRVITKDVFRKYFWYVKEEMAKHGREKTWGGVECPV